MTDLLDRAIQQVQGLDPADQDSIAAVILEELEDEARWRRSFAASQDELAKLAEEALEELQAGRTRELDPDRL